MKNECPQITISKEVLAELPHASYPGGIEAITLIDNAAAADAVLPELTSCRMLGFDTETRPSFQRGQVNKVALLQLSTGDHCYLFRLNRPGIYDKVRCLLEDPEILKIGLSVNDDFSSLRRRGDLNPQGFLDLQDYCRSFNIADTSLQKIFAIVFGLRISKAQRLTNWEAEHLTDAQQIYAALDAWACLELYRFIRNGNFAPQNNEWLNREE